MPKPLNTVLAQIAQGKSPAVILIGGSSDYLSERAFRDIRDAIVAANPNIAIESFEAGIRHFGHPQRFARFEAISQSLVIGGHRIGPR